MSSTFIYNLRKWAGDPFSVRWKLLSERLAAFEARNAQVEQPDFLNEQLMGDSRLKYQEIGHTNTRPSSTIFYFPFEPDLNYLTCWLTFESWANVLPDASLMGNDAHFIPARNIPSGIEGPLKGYGGGSIPHPSSDDPSVIDDTSGSVAVLLDGETQSMAVYDVPGVRLSGTTVGISVATLVRPLTFNRTAGGMSRYVVSKVDDSKNYYGIWLEAGTGAATGQGGFSSHFTTHFASISLLGGFTSHFTAGFMSIVPLGIPGGGFTSAYTFRYVNSAGTPPPDPGGGTPASGVIHFWVFDNGVDRSVRTLVNVLNLDQWAWVACTFNQSTNVASIYVNGRPAPIVNDTITDGTILAGSQDLSTDMHIFSGREGDGHFQGGVSDFRFYREKVLTDAEVFNLDMNMISISNIPIGNICKTGFSLFS